MKFNAETATREELVSELHRVQQERKKLFDLMSEWKHPLFEMRMNVLSTQGPIDTHIHNVRKDWFEEFGYPHEQKT